MDITNETASPAAPITSAEDFRLPVDPEHSGLRMMIVLVFLISGVILYVLMTRLIPELSGINIIAVVVALAGATILTQVIDRLFKQRWPSGRVLRIIGDNVQLALRDHVQREIDGGQHVNVLMWRFTIAKRTRIPKGWYMVAIALQQDDRYLPVYTFVRRMNLTLSLTVNSTQRSNPRRKMNSRI
jgi:hypothetical protein